MLISKRGIKGRRASFGAVLAIALCFALIGGTVGAFLTQNAQAEAQSNPGYDVVYSSDNPIPEIAEKVRPAIVQVVNRAQRWDTGSRSVSTQDQAYGSGVFVDEKGYIITNYHVIQDADEIEIVTLDGKSIPATLVGYDDGTDIAVLKIEEKLDADPVSMGDSDALQIGELAICIGNPGVSSTVLYGTVTAGIISALDRTEVGSGNRSVNTIQIDAAINSGNSGGALLNAKGELVGIPSMKIGGSYYMGSYEGLGFAIPINTVKSVMEEIIETGTVTRPRIGISVQDFDGPDEAISSRPPAGIQVMAVEENSPGEKAGMLKFDVIIEIDGTRVKSYSQMTMLLDQYKAGDTLKIKVYRYYDPETGEKISKPGEVEMDVTLEILDK